MLNYYFTNSNNNHHQVIHHKPIHPVKYIELEELALLFIERKSLRVQNVSEVICIIIYSIPLITCTIQKFLF